MACLCCCSLLQAGHSQAHTEARDKLAARGSTHLARGPACACLQNQWSQGVTDGCSSMSMQMGHLQGAGQGRQGRQARKGPSVCEQTGR